MVGRSLIEWGRQVPLPLFMNNGKNPSPTKTKSQFSKKNSDAKVFQNTMKTVITNFVKADQGIVLS